jgi:ABC-type glutathione transport system ATPase component
MLAIGVQLQATSFQSQLTIKQIVRLYAGLYGVRLSDPEITAGLREIGLEGEASKPFKQLSGGQQQRLSLYVAVVHDPALLLLDEPTNGPRRTQHARDGRLGVAPGPARGSDRRRVPATALLSQSALLLGRG